MYPHLADATLAMDFAQAVDFLLSLTDYERQPGSGGDYDLRRMYLLLERLGNPERAARSVHIAGTKGKGTTAALIASALKAAGHRTGLFTSPHLHSICERIALDGQPIPQGKWARLTSRLRPEVEAVNREAAFGRLTTFECLTALAFLYFREQGTHFQVLEVGLGGRLDATNVVVPELAVITSISLDHTAVLGNTLPLIAREKAGIIKPGRPVVSSPQAPEVLAVLEEVCRERQAPLTMVGRDVLAERGGHTLEGQSLAVWARERHDLWIPFLGAHQVENAAVAVAALEILGVGQAAIARGLATASWPGRLEVLGQHPLVVVDGAHNRDSARRLREALRDYFQFQRLVLVLGTSWDKDAAGIVAELAPAAAEVIVTRSRHPRSLSPDTLEGEVAKHGVPTRSAPDTGQAVALARTLAGPEDLILATGSLFIVAEAREALAKLPIS